MGLIFNRGGLQTRVHSETPPLESDSENVNNMAAATSETCANVKTPGKKSSSKSRSSSSASKNKSTKSKVSSEW